MYAILEGEKEVERVLFRKEGKDGFVLIMDSDWTDKADIKSMHILALVEDR